jgi:hypothetical protein
MLRHSPFALLRSFALVLGTASAPALAQGLCQLHFGGSIAVQDVVVGDADGDGKEGETTRRIRSTGHLVEVEIGAFAGQVERDLALHIHLARGTTGADLARLIARRLERLGVEVTLGAAEGDEASLWIDGARHVALRLGGGINVDVACAEGPPKSLRLMPPTAILADARLTVSASAALILRDRPPLRSRVATDIKLEADMSSAAAAKRLWDATSKAWVSDRPGGDAWQPHKMQNGATITGVSFHLDSPGRGDWRFELEL